MKLRHVLFALVLAIAAPLSAQEAAEGEQPADEPQKPPQVTKAPRLVHFVVYAAGVPVLRTLSFPAGWIAQIVILVSILHGI